MLANRMRTLQFQVVTQGDPIMFGEYKHTIVKLPKRLRLAVLSEIMKGQPSGYLTLDGAHGGITEISYDTTQV